MSDDMIDKLVAYRKHLRAAGRLLEARAVTRCIQLIKESQKS